MADEGGASGLARVSSPTARIAPELRSPLLAGEVAAAASYRRRAKAQNTIRAYASDWCQFEGWCDDPGLDPLPARPESVATYLAALAQAGRADSTIGRHLAAIGWQHRQQGHVPPTARDERKVNRRHARGHPPRDARAAEREESGHRCR